LTQREPRVGIFGWGIVAPRSPDVDSFERNLERGGTWLEPFHGFGPDNFLVGCPEFELETYRGWIGERFAPNRFAQIQSKMGLPTQYAMGAFIQALAQNPGIEDELDRLGAEAHVYVGTGVGDLPTIYEASLRLDRAQARWDRFWADPARNEPLRRHLAERGSSRGTTPRAVVMAIGDAAMGGGAMGAASASAAAAAAIDAAALAYGDAIPVDPAALDGDAR
jgi:3-oxoacyl-(acyl-carrier-protein) synthase